jgi:hypothetical protein
MKKVREVNNQVDTYLEGLSYGMMTKMNTDQLYNKIFHDISSIVTKEYKDLDMTANTEVQISMSLLDNSYKIIITGYIKVEDGFIHIENVYLPEGYKDELTMEDTKRPT